MDATTEAVQAVGGGRSEGEGRKVRVVVGTNTARAWCIADGRAVAVARLPAQPGWWWWGAAVVVAGPLERKGSERQQGRAAAGRGVDVGSGCACACASASAVVGCSRGLSARAKGEGKGAA